MEKNKKHKEEQTKAAQKENKPVDQEPEGKTEAAHETKESEAFEVVKKSIEDEMTEKMAEMQDKYLRLSAEFDNYRRRTLKEKMEITKTAGESILISILPVIDDFERALKSMDKVENCDSIKEGVVLIYNKLNDFLKQNGVKEIEALNKEFDGDHHEAVTKIPAPEESARGKVVDVIQKGYSLNEKIIRFPKVVVGE
ncbi:MAG TPA: nucleotide exchange factor GrpE [Bacteroidales bacterium]|nr:nucleotide exchange factor GrpE [Bacteroidales bacterium]